MKKLKIKISPFAVVTFILLIVYTLILLIQLFWGFNVSLKSDSAVQTDLFSIKPPFVFGNYLKVFEQMKVSVSSVTSGVHDYYMEHMLWFTFVYAVCCSFINVAVICATAYVTARFDFKICKVIDAIVIITMILPIVGSMPSELRIVHALGMYDTLWGMMIMKANFLGGTTFLIFNVSFKGLPKDFSEAAQIDGASNFTVMLKIMLPLARTMFLTLWLLSFIQFWNDYQTPLLYFPSKPTLSYGLLMFINDSTSEATNLQIALAACFILMIPILIIFLFASEKLIGNVSMGGLKE